MSWCLGQRAAQSAITGKGSPTDENPPFIIKFPEVVTVLIQGLRTMLLSNTIRLSRVVCGPIKWNSKPAKKVRMNKKVK